MKTSLPVLGKFGREAIEAVQDIARSFDKCSVAANVSRVKGLVALF